MITGLPLAHDAVPEPQIPAQTILRSQHRSAPEQLPTPPRLRNSRKRVFVLDTMNS
ncbi:hypothetical protein BKA67DRAFT_566587 [Truncatella angustata]|uniref:Uncharacterized protein n=1 Tax=Truncatella angustata TaxID=152316 RepID=A0A9P8ZZC3_9PEZI|nr:uncharacterized protein BKA67DRAFT_566587 [Truncatella angustata]KAH6654906.1 hypothetical protein BKA67DRAFT_566587 [Truncatella angustata]